MVAMSQSAAWRRLEQATADLEPPFALVDLDAFWANAADMERRAAPKPIRLASKSVRCRALQERVLARPGFHGTLAFTLPEALWLAHHGFQDIVVAYPSVDRHALRELAALTAQQPQARVTLMVDCIEQLDLIDAALARSPRRATAHGPAHSPPEGADSDSPLAAADSDSPLRVCLEIDAGFRPLGGRLRIGAKRSPVHSPEQAIALARAIVARPAVTLVGAMAYESQIAGLGDSPLGQPLRALVIRLLQAASSRELAARRAAVIAAVEEVLATAARRGGRAEASNIAAGGNAVGDSRVGGLSPAPVTSSALEFVNGGGTGSLEGTSAEAAITELAAGSGLYGPTLFDAYRSFKPRPAAMFALPIVRRPRARVVTALGGGYLASGPANSSRLPQPYLPAALRLDSQEGAGEVQTPLLGDAADELALGQRVYFRHAKAGELCERFNRLYLIEGDRVVDEVPTYRGEGQCFL
jgi:D-serine deaminase-like pyridoxal phosphate-dependent protein